MRTKDETKVHLILNTALKMIARVGLAGLKMSDLAKEAGVATGTVYIYFEDKNHLIRELYMYLHHAHARDLVRDIGESEPLKIKIKKMSRNYLLDQVSHPEYGAFLEQYFRSPYAETNDAMRVERELLTQPLHSLVVEGQYQSLIKEADPVLLVTLICGMLNEVAKKLIYAQKEMTPSEWELTFSVLWDGIRS